MRLTRYHYTTCKASTSFSQLIMQNKINNLQTNKGHISVNLNLLRQKINLAHSFKCVDLLIGIKRPQFKFVFQIYETICNGNNANLSQLL